MEVATTMPAAKLNGLPQSSTVVPSSVSQSPSTVSSGPVTSQLPSVSTFPTASQSSPSATVLQSTVAPVPIISQTAAGLLASAPIIPQTKVSSGSTVSQTAAAPASSKVSQLPAAPAPVSSGPPTSTTPMSSTVSQSSGKPTGPPPVSHSQSVPPSSTISQSISSSATTTSQPKVVPKESAMTPKIVPTSDSKPVNNNKVESADIISEPSPANCSNTKANTKLEEIMNDSTTTTGTADMKKTPGPGVDVKVLKEEMKVAQTHEGGGSGFNIGEDVATITARMGQLDCMNPNRNSPNSGFGSSTTATADPKDQGDVPAAVIRGPGREQTKSSTTKNRGLTSSGSPAKGKTPPTRSVSAAVTKERPLTSASSERAFSASTSGRKTRTSTTTKDNLSNSPLAASASPELIAKSFGGSTPSFHLRPSSSLFRPTTSFAAKKVPQGTSPKQGLSLKSTKSYIGTTSTPSPTNKPRMGDAGGSPTATEGSGEKPNLRDQFTAFSRFGDISSDGKQITLSNCDKWMKQAHVIDGKKITTTDTSITFKKLFKTAKKVGFEDFKRYIEDLATAKKLEPKEIFDKLAGAGTPGLSGSTKAANAGVVERLTDTSKYTGSHKERFDSAGKGKGIVGRREVSDNTGYVAAFNDKKKEDSSSPAPASATPK